MATTITGKLNKHAQIIAAGESTGFGIRLGVKCYNRKTKQEEWTNYQAVIFAKAAAQIQFYQSALVEGAIVEVSGDKLLINQYQGQNGLQLSIEILDAKLGFVSSPQANAQAPAPQQAKPAYNPAPAQQQMPNAGGYANNAAGRSMNQGGPAEPNIDFDDDIPFAPIGLQCKRLLHCI